MCAFRLTRSTVSCNSADVGRWDVTLLLTGEEFDEVPLAYYIGEPKLEPTLMTFQSRVLSRLASTLSLMPSQQTRLICGFLCCKSKFATLAYFLKRGPKTSRNNKRGMEISFTGISLWGAGKDLANHLTAGAVMKWLWEMVKVLFRKDLPIHLLALLQLPISNFYFPIWIQSLGCSVGNDHCWVQCMKFSAREAVFDGVTFGPLWGTLPGLSYCAWTGLARHQWPVICNIWIMPSPWVTNLGTLPSLW